MAVLEDSNDFTLVLVANKKGAAVYPEAFHIGFMLDSKEEVIKMHTSLKNVGYAAGQEPKKIRDSFGFYFPFDNIMIEVGHYLD